MSLGSMDRNPPAFFRQGPSALTKLMLFSALAVFLMAADSRWRITQPLRAALATALLPMQQTLQTPVELGTNALRYLQGIRTAQAAEIAARTQLARQSERANRMDQLMAENDRLRAERDELLNACRAIRDVAPALRSAVDSYVIQTYGKWEDGTSPAVCAINRAVAAVGLLPKEER